MVVNVSGLCLGTIPVECDRDERSQQNKHTHSTRACLSETTTSSSMNQYYDRRLRHELKSSRGIFIRILFMCCLFAYSYTYNLMAKDYVLFKVRRTIVSMLLQVNLAKSKRTVFMVHFRYEYILVFKLQ